MIPALQVEGFGTGRWSGLGGGMGGGGKERGSSSVAFGAIRHRVLNIKDHPPGSSSSREAADPTAKTKLKPDGMAKKRRCSKKKKGRGNRNDNGTGRWPR